MTLDSQGLMTRSSLLLTASAALCLGACAGASQPAGVTPKGEDVSALEAQRARHPGDVTLLTKLGIAYYEAKNYERARESLMGTLAVEKKSYIATVYLGLSQEELGDLAGARTSYQAAAALTASETQKKEIANRLALLTKKELRQAAQKAIAQEDQLSKEIPAPNTVAVLPFRYLGTDDELRPLERGLTFLVITDLSRVKRLTLLEREQVQSLVDELKLSESGRVDPRTGARSGRLLRASSVVQGALQDVPATSKLKVDADVVSSTTAKIVASGTAVDKLQQLLDVEKQVVFQLLDRLGIRLTPAERRAVSERPTADLQAFLAFSRGLQAEDRGDYEAAEKEYAAAALRDPSFRVASQRQAATQQLTSVALVPPRQLAGVTFGAPAPVRGGPLGPSPIMLSLRDGTIPTIITQLPTGNVGGGSSPPPSRCVVCEGTGTDNPTLPGGLTGNIIIIITRP
jgi:TolB-like protein